MEGETFLWLIRHATVEGVAGTIHAADARADLGDHAALVALRQHLPPDATSYASPSRRTVETARALRLEPELVSEFREQDFGDWTGRRHDELAAAGGETYAQFWHDPAHERPPNGESFADQVARVRLGLSRIGAGSATLVVHSGTIRAALCIALDLTPRAALRFVIDPLSLTRIDRLTAGWRVVSVNQRVA
ncbi:MULTISPECIES: histidine phosphatase family protein [Bradyrhizobium]|uniref:Histidine phosphatase family protein n=1 Tax=Bradyrhizobium diversitatis TaxID=2755406 RepID=A0ABS0P9R4_9BRAD|nr:MULTISPECIES: histidine phosphatase family protein [Bradyrhizobium]MBH5390040.1 histidine phosphatase family protein [Bradyrhizobium diversitatis]UPJ67083.1 histidine phosphatase family protein [Bradyrhizobium sp. 191]